MLALSTIKVEIRAQQQLDSLVDVYLASYGQHIKMISLQGATATGTVVLRQLPATLTTLTSLHVDSIQVQLQPWDGCRGILEAVAASGPHLKQLRLNKCKPLGGQGEQASLDAALSRMSDLEHLSISWANATSKNEWGMSGVPVGGCGVWSQLADLSSMHVETRA